MSRVPAQLVLNASNAATLLGRIADSEHPDRQLAYWSITKLWLGPERTHVTYTPTDEMLGVLEGIDLPEGVVTSHRYVAVYRDPVSKAQVILRSNLRPKKRRTLKAAGGKRRFIRIALKDLHKETATMAKKAAASKGKKSAKAEVEDELEDELAGLEELEDEDAEDEDVETEEDEDEDEESDEDDDEGTDYASLTNAELKALCKERGLKGFDKANKTKLVGLLEASDAEDGDEDEEDEDDDESPLDGLDRSELKAYNKEHELGVAVKKSMSDDELREAMQLAIDESDEDEEDDEEDEEDDEPIKRKAPVKGKGKTPAKGGAKKGNTPPARRELPKGRLSAADVAELAGTDGRSVRMYLRTDEGKELFPKDEELGRYSFTKKEAATLVKKLKGRKGSKAAKGK